MKTYKYKLGDQSNCIRIGNLLDDMWQVHDYFHRWQDKRYKDGLLLCEVCQCAVFAIGVCLAGLGGITSLARG